jgi:hypothetical protein
VLEDEQEQRLLDSLDPLLSFCEGRGLDELDSLPAPVARAL